MRRGNQRRKGRDRQHTFSTLPTADIPRSQFDRSHRHITALPKAGLLYPVLVEEILPGDTINLQMDSFLRLATPLKPFFSRLVVDSWAFFVPHRIVWGNWSRFMGAKVDPDDDTTFIVPEVTQPVGGFQRGGLLDFMGIPPDQEFYSGPEGATRISALHPRAYNLIHREWFRAEQLEATAVVNQLDGPDPEAWYTLLPRTKRPDYFSSATPYQQQGDPVELPLSGTAPVIPDFNTNGGVPTFDNSLSVDGITNTAGQLIEFAPGTGAGQQLAWAGPALLADMSQATMAAVSTIRTGFQIQKILERDARSGGLRLTEILQAHFGVNNPDHRLQRPELLGLSSQVMNINSVPQTTPSDGAPSEFDSQGNLAAFGVTHGSGLRAFKSFTEHGTLMVLVSVRGDLDYQEGIHQKWTRSDKFDFFWPAFSNISEQPILGRELVATGNSSDVEAWGWQEAWASYRYSPSNITGKMRSSDPTSLDYWHLAQDFGGVLPELGPDFIHEDPPVERVVAVPTEPHFIGQFDFSLKHARPMPTFSVPGLVDHF